MRPKLNYCADVRPTTLLALTGGAIATRCGILLVAMALDWLFGEPEILWRHMPHPVVIFGRGISFFDRSGTRDDASGRQRRLRGAVPWPFSSCRRLAGVLISLGGRSLPVLFWRSCWPHARLTSIFVPSQQRWMAASNRHVSRRYDCRTLPANWRPTTSRAPPSRPVQRTCRMASSPRQCGLSGRPARGHNLQACQHGRQHDRLPKCTLSCLRMCGSTAG